jgi:hypothetical protein
MTKPNNLWMLLLCGLFVGCVTVNYTLYPLEVDLNTKQNRYSVTKTSHFVVLRLRLPYELKAGRYKVGAAVANYDVRIENNLLQPGESTLITVYDQGTKPTEDVLKVAIEAENGLWATTLQVTILDLSR